MSSTSFAVLVNGNAKGWVKVTRVLRQGDLLFSFFFTIATGVLSRMMLRVEESGLLERFLSSRDEIRVFHLQFCR